MTGKVRIGTSGWHYKHWRGDFYPPGLVQRRELEYASRAFSTIELNASFYALQTPARYSNWYRQVPDNFVFSVKAPRHITHAKRAGNIEGSLADFFASGLLQLKHKLGPVLWQFPPSRQVDHSLEDFLALLPRSSRDATELARNSARKTEPGGVPDGENSRGLRHAVEIRSHNGLDQHFIAVLRRHSVALVVADTPGKWPYQEDITADFVYIRLHVFESNYSPRQLGQWRKRIEVWANGRQPKDARLIDTSQTGAGKPCDVYCYFNNDINTYAPHNACDLAKQLDPASH